VRVWGLRQVLLDGVAVVALAGSAVSGAQAVEPLFSAAAPSPNSPSSEASLRVPNGLAFDTGDAGQQARNDGAARAGKVPPPAVRKAGPPATVPAGKAETPSDRVPVGLAFDTGGGRQRPRDDIADRASGGPPPAVRRAGPPARVTTNKAETSSGPAPGGLTFDMGRPGQQLAGGSDIDGAGPSPTASRGKPTPPAATPAARSAPPTSEPTIRGIVFVSDPALLTDAPPSRARGQVMAVGLPFLDRRFMADAHLAVGQSLTLDRLDALAALAVDYASESGREVVDAYVPAQDVTGGIVQIVVAVGRIGKVRTEGNDYFSDTRLVEMFGFDSGDEVRSDLVNAKLDRMNRSRFRDVDAIYTAGDEPGTTDVVLKTKDRFPVRPFATVDNSGTRLIDPLRISAGFVWGDVLWTDHELAYQYIRAPDGQAFQGHALSYRFDLPNDAEVAISGGYSRARTKVADFTVRGRSIQAAARYSQSLPEIPGVEDYDHGFSAKVDFKRSNSDVQFGGESEFASDVDVIQLTGGYDASMLDDWGETTAGVEVVLSPGNLSPNNNDELFEQARSGSRADYLIGKISLGRRFDLPFGGTLQADFDAQTSGALLQASERFSLGGPGSVRGYGTSTYTGDSGYLLTAELASPTLPVLGFLDDELKDGITAVVFYDRGFAELNQPAIGQAEEELLSSYGYGLRYSFAPYLAMRFDHAWPMQTLSDGSGEGSRFHFSVAVGY